MLRDRLSVSFESLVLFALIVFPLLGCGSREGSTLIEPTVEYQPTEQEKINRAAIDVAREGDR